MKRHRSFVFRYGKKMKFRDATKTNHVFLFRTGTTWTGELVSLIYNNGDTSKVKKKMLKHRVDHLEFGRTSDHLRRLRQVKSPRLLSSHLPLPLIPKCLRQGKCKVSAPTNVWKS
ncbi:hypothetical protein AVEN_35168-1 [Araneus ventricosus]|uniref:Sulfotransferase domain-containing protein n=1 Tax=Araneus ventricosus TaxID=182803 RepID=A0A4Y2KKL3_ARAVE|nr:hypothetical protein AVEN_35168-1 [Araneus ventricosus]